MARFEVKESTERIPSLHVLDTETGSKWLFGSPTTAADVAARANENPNHMAMFTEHREIV